jgi:hypothetical protein
MLSIGVDDFTKTIISCSISMRYVYVHAHGDIREVLVPSELRSSAAIYLKKKKCKNHFFVGVLENIAGAYVVGTELKLSVALVIIVGVLVFKPAGLFGRTLVARV